MCRITTTISDAKLIILITIFMTAEVTPNNALLSSSVVEAFSSQFTTRIRGGKNNNNRNSKLLFIIDDDRTITDEDSTVSSSSSSSSFTSRTTTTTRMTSTTSLNLSIQNSNNKNKTDNDNTDNEDNNLINSIIGALFSFSSLMAIWLPTFAIWGIPVLVNYARSFPPNSSEQFTAVTLLIVSNRIYLYTLAVTIVGLAATRGSQYDPSSLGRRLTLLTEELLIFDRPLALDNKIIEEEVIESESVIRISDDDKKEVLKTPTPSFIQKMFNDSGLEENLDNVNTETQALVLPVLVSGLLAVSVLSLPFLESDGLFGTPILGVSTIDNELFLQLKKSIADVLPVVSQGWNALILALFTRAEIRRLSYELFGLEVKNVEGEVEVENDLERSSRNNDIQIILEIVVAITITGYGAYYLQYWPACNFVNMSIAILVARAIQLDTFQSIVGTLALFAIYDGVSVLLIPAAANALTMADTSTASTSAMGSVAIQKLTSTTFQPGLLVTKLDGALTGALGLGDQVFPSILATFLKRFDDDMNNDIVVNKNGKTTTTTTKRHPTKSTSSISLFVLSLVGYIFGCILCEFAPTISSGIPALVFILPSMLTFTLCGAVISNQFDDLWNYNSSEHAGNNSKKENNNNNGR